MMIRLLKTGSAAGALAGLVLAYVDLWSAGIGLWQSDPVGSLLQIGHTATVYAAVGGLVGILAACPFAAAGAMAARQWGDQTAARVARWLAVAAAALLVIGIHVRGVGGAEQLGVAALVVLVLLGTAGWLGSEGAPSQAPSRTAALLAGVLAGWALFYALERIVGYSGRSLPVVVVFAAGFAAAGAATGYVACRLTGWLIGLLARRLTEQQAVYVLVSLCAVPLLLLAGVKALARTAAEDTEPQVVFAGREATEPDFRPNVILISVDTLRPDFLGSGGGRARTPNIDRLADESYVFDNAYSVAPWTRPSFAAFFSGRYPSEIGVGRVAGRDAPGTGVIPYEWREDGPLLGELLHEAGYSTAAVVTNPHLTHEAHADQGFELFVNCEAEATQERAEPPRPALDSVVRFVSHLLGRSPGREQDRGASGGCARADRISRRAEEVMAGLPRTAALLWLHYMDPHQPYDPPDIPDEERVRLDHVAVMSGICMHAAPEREKLIRAYQREIEYCDASLRAVMDDLKATGLWDTSVIVLWSDHGEEFWEHGGWEHGHSLYNEVLHVPLVIHMPGQVNGRRIRQPVSLLDVLPTLLDLCEVERPPDLRGRSLVPLLRIPPREIEPFRVYLEGPYRGAIRQGLMTERYKLILDTYQDSFELYDLRSDPGEQHNLHGLPGAPDTAALEAELRQWSEDMLALMAPYETAGAEPISATARQQLRDLGYVQ